MATENAESGFRRYIFTRPSDLAIAVCVVPPVLCETPEEYSMEGSVKNSHPFRMYWFDFLLLFAANSGWPPR